MSTICIRQKAAAKGKHHISLSLKRSGQPDLEAQATIKFALTPQEQEELRWYMKDYLQRAESVEEVEVQQIETWMKQRGEELYSRVLDADQDTRAIWFAVREQLADLRIEITTGIAEAASIPWELMRDPQSDSAIALRVQSFVRVQSDPSISFVPVPPAAEGRLRLLYAVCRPGGRDDVELRAVANRLLQGLGADLARFDITALRPPTFEQLQKELTDAKTADRPFHIVHFDGHGIYADLSNTPLADWLKAINALTLGGKPNGKHGYLMFEHPGSNENTRPVSGGELGKLLRDTGVPVLVLNACQSAMHEAWSSPADQTDSAKATSIPRSSRGNEAQTPSISETPRSPQLRRSAMFIESASSTIPPSSVGAPWHRPRSPAHGTDPARRKTMPLLRSLVGFWGGFVSTSQHRSSSHLGQLTN